MQAPRTEAIGDADPEIKAPKLTARFGDAMRDDETRKLQRRIPPEKSCKFYTQADHHSEVPRLQRKSKGAMTRLRHVV
jgi:hypothetical protein